MRRFLGTLIMATLVVCLIAAGVGFYQGWWTASTAPSPSDQGKVTVSLEVDTHKIKEDTEEARKSASKVGEAVKDKLEELAGTTTVQGKLAKVEATERSLALTTGESKEMTFHLVSSAELKRDGEQCELKDLKPGDQVKVVYKVEEGRNMARSVKADSVS